MKLCKQYGATLISLLIGMVVSMLAILASLSMFHHLVQASTEAKTDARQEGDLSLAVLRLDTELQSAGFNMSRTPGIGRNVDFVAAPQTAAGRSDVAWKFNDGNGFICRRVTSSITAGRYTLDLSNALAANCTANLDLQANIAAEASWVFTERLADLQLQNLATGSALFAQPLIRFDAPVAGDGPCMPFGAMPTGAAAVNHPVLRLSIFDVATVYANLAAGAAPPASRIHSLCLANIFL